MILVDTALQKRHQAKNPIRVGMVGAGFMGRGIALQIARSVPGMRLVAIANRKLEGARRAYTEAEVLNVKIVETVNQLEDAIGQDQFSITEDPMLLCQASNIDVIIEVTGAVEFGAHVAMEGIRNHKHIVFMNAELDGTIGPILKVYADKAGVVVTNVDGDQPGVMMNLYRFVKGLGIAPVLCGNIKGLHDPYRNPTTQEGFAKKWKQNPYMVTSFADGTKISFEQAIVANATGMKIAKRGMCGPTVPGGTPIRETIQHFPTDFMVPGSGIVDYVVGAEPSPGVFVVGMETHPLQRHYLDLYKLGGGPYYCFYTPYHLCHFEVPNSVARAVLFQDATIAPIGAPCVDVVATAKVDLKSGQTLDGFGGYLTYGLAEKSQIVHERRLLPMGLAEGCTLNNDVFRDQVLTYDDVQIPVDRLSDRLRAEQDEYFF